MIILSLVVVGAAGYFKLGVDRFPSVDLPTVTIRTALPGAAPEEVETLVTQPVEEAVNTVDGIDELRSVSGQGSSLVIATFKLDRDLETAAQDVRDRVSGLGRRLPADAFAPVVFKFDNDSTPVLTLALTSNRSPRELTELGDKIVRPQFERVSGVGEARVVGGAQRAINVWLDAERLEAYQLSATTVRQALARQNADVPGGNVQTNREEMALRTMGRFPDARSMSDLVIANIGNTPIRLSDVGRVEDGTKEQRSISRLNGAPTVTMEIRRQSGANTMEVIAGVKKQLALAQQQLPADVKLEIIRDQSRFIEAALHEIKTHLVLGSFLACLVVLLFMRSWRSTIIAGVAIPTSVVATFGMMWALDFTLNSVTMLALVLMVGVVIDVAIVVLENIFRFIEEKQMHPMDAAREATRDIGMAVMATTFSLVVIFVPVSFMSSISGRFLYQFGITAAVAILVSLVVSFTLTPMMSARLLRAEGGGMRDEEEDAEAQADSSLIPHPSALNSRGGFYGVIDRNYTRLLRLAMRHRVITAALAIGVIYSTVPLYGLIKQEFIPTNVDEAEFEVSVNAPEGINLPVMNEMMQGVEKELLATPGVTLVLSGTGGSFLGNVNQGNAYVRIEPHDNRVFSLTKLWRELRQGHPLKAWRGNYSQQDVVQEVRRRLKKFAPLRISARSSNSFNFGTGGRNDIDFALRGPDIAQLANYAEELRTRTEKAGGFVDGDTTLKLNKPEMRVEIDRGRAAELGVDTTDISNSLRLMVGGDEQASRFQDDSINQSYDVQLRLDPRYRDSAQVISQLYVPSSKGGLIRLDNLVSLKRADSPSRIDRIDRQRQVSFRANVAPGFALADRLEAIKKISAEMNMPPAYTTFVSGRGRELERTFNEFIWAFLLSVIFMYIILASQFEHLIHPITILLSLPLAIPFALLSQWITGDTLNLYSALGILVLFGVVKKNSILQIDHINNLRAKGLERYDAIIQGNRDRLRPILMTTLALVAGMTPLALGSGPGAEERRSVAVVVIGGQTLSLLLTLLVTPVAYSIFDDLGAREFWALRAERISGFFKHRQARDEELPETAEALDAADVPFEPESRPG